METAKDTKVTQQRTQSAVEDNDNKQKLIFMAKWCFMTLLGVSDYTTDIIASASFINNSFFVCDYCAPNTVTSGVFLLILSTVGFILSLYGKYKQCIKQQGTSSSETSDDNERMVWKLTITELRTLLKVLVEDITSILIILILSVTLGQLSAFYMFSCILSLSTITAEILFEFKKKGLLFSTLLIIVLLPTLIAINEKTQTDDIHQISVNNECYDYYTSEREAENSDKTQIFDANVNVYSNITNKNLVYTFNCKIDYHFECEWEFNDDNNGNCKLSMSIDDYCSQIPANNYCSSNNNNSIYFSNYIPTETVFDFCQLKCDFAEDANKAVLPLYTVVIWLCAIVLGFIVLYGIYSWIMFCKNGCNVNQ